VLASENHNSSPTCIILHQLMQRQTKTALQSTKLMWCGVQWSAVFNCYSYVKKYFTSACRRNYKNESETIIIKNKAMQQQQLNAEENHVKLFLHTAVFIWVNIWKNYWFWLRLILKWRNF